MNKNHTHTHTHTQFTLKMKHTVCSDKNAKCTRCRDVVWWQFDACKCKRMDILHPKYKSCASLCAVCAQRDCYSKYRRLYSYLKAMSFVGKMNLLLLFARSILFLTLSRPHISYLNERYDPSTKWQSSIHCACLGVCVWIFHLHRRLSVEVE